MIRPVYVEATPEEMERLRRGLERLIRHVQNRPLSAAGGKEQSDGHLGKDIHDSAGHVPVVAGQQDQPG